MDIRPLRWPDEIPLWAALYSAVNPDRTLTTGEIERQFGSMAEAGYFLAVDGADAIGYGCVARRDAPLPLARVIVLPAHRRRGTGSALFAEICEWSGAHGHRELRATVRETHPEGLEFAAHRGFVETGRERWLELDLTAVDEPSVSVAGGAEIVRLAERPDLAQGLYEAFCEAVLDSPGEEDYEIETLEEWLALGATLGMTPETTFVAVADGEVVGYAMLASREGLPLRANHLGTGVRRAWRGRGIAGALKAMQIRWAKQAGYARLVTQNEGSNAPILRLNERFGYRPVAGDVLMRGPITGGR